MATAQRGNLLQLDRPYRSILTFPGGQCDEIRVRPVIVGAGTQRRIRDERTAIADKLDAALIPTGAVYVCVAAERAMTYGQS
jgi:hypothetical protein